MDCWPNCQVHKCQLFQHLVLKQQPIDTCSQTKFQTQFDLQIVMLKRLRSRQVLNYFVPGQENSKQWDIYSQNLLNLNKIERPLSNRRQKLKIQHLPTELGVQELDLIQCLQQYSGIGSVLFCDINKIDRFSLVQMKTAQSAIKLCKLQKIQFLPGYQLLITRAGGSLFGQTKDAHMKSKVKTAVQAHATVVTALLQIQKKNIGFELSFSKNQLQKSSLLKLANAVPITKVNSLSDQQWNDYQEDILFQLKNYGTVVRAAFIRPGLKSRCLQVANIRKLQKRNRASKGDCSKGGHCVRSQFRRTWWSFKNIFRTAKFDMQILDKLIFYRIILFQEVQSPALHCHFPKPPPFSQSDKSSVLDQFIGQQHPLQKAPYSKKMQISLLKDYKVQLKQYQSQQIKALSVIQHQEYSQPTYVNAQLQDIMQFNRPTANFKTEEPICIQEFKTQATSVQKQESKVQEKGREKSRKLIFQGIVPQRVIKSITVLKHNTEDC